MAEKYIALSKILEKAQFNAVVTVEDIEALPGADVVPAAPAEWAPVQYDGYADGAPVWDTWQCSNCCEEYESEGDPPSFSFCPSCGAKMEV